jgi:hypothetical protein
MNSRFCVSLGILALALSAPLPGQAPSGAAKSSSAAKAKNAALPRTPDGHPDLSGVWTNATITPMERPAAYAGKPTLTEAEAKEFEKKSAQELADVDGKSESPLLAAAGSNGTGGYNILFIDRGSELARVDGVRRTSLIVDPADGKVPQLTAEGRKRSNAAMRSNFIFSSVKERPLSERCLLGFGSTSGPPMLPVLYNNNYEIVQTPDTVMILVEMVHDIRIVRINGTHPPADVHQWLGDSIGHWDGDTLVVDTTNFTDQTRFEGSGDKLHVIERFQRVDASTILYRVTIDDPSTFTRQWTLEYPARPRV